MTIYHYILEHGDTEIKRLRAELKRQRFLNAELLEALQVIANAAELEVAQSIACSAIAIAIVKEEEK